MLKTQDEEKVKAQLLRMIHSLFLQVSFAYLMNIPQIPNFAEQTVCCRKLNGKGGAFPPIPLTDGFRDCFLALP